MKNIFTGHTHSQMKINKAPRLSKNEKIKNWLIGIACLTIFPLLYLIGRTITLWFE